MAQKNETLPLVMAFLITCGIVGGGVWWFLQRSSNLPVAETTPTQPVVETTPTQPVAETTPTQPDNLPSIPIPPTTTASQDFPFVSQVPMGTTIRINGSTSMVQVNEAFKKGFTQQYPGTIVIAKASGTEVGLKELLEGTVDIAAMSRPLTPGEQQQGLASIPVVRDAIAVFVGVNNPFTGSLTSQQVAGIFQGRIQNWSEVGGPNVPLRVINRAPTSGTYGFFQEVALQGQDFGNTPNITTLTVDATTPIIRDIGTNGISYATYSQVINQSTAKIVPIDGLNPNDGNYPLQRILYYVYREPASPQVEAFLGFVRSPQGQQSL